jgi:hypothetical protein
MTTILQKRATDALQFFTHKTRANGTAYVCLAENTPEKIRGLCQEAHNLMLPDDYKFEYIFDALDKLSCYEDPDEIEIEADIYNSDLLTWLSSNVERLGYCDTARSDGLVGKDADLIQQIGTGQWAEREEVLQIVKQQLMSEE